MAQEYYGTAEEEALLDFDQTMRDFREMFPNVMASQIEHVLRKYDGDVSATINELLYENTPSTPSSSQLLPGDDVLTRLRRRRHEINEKLRENQKLLDKVTDVDSARTYEDQQLALLLEHREVNTLISEEKSSKRKT
uniref:CUE domain-containing protein n=1 Tax=Caenorhabditis tropicalis TaxID=1561998 RepID=A0A1I7TWQ2_9PELO